MLGPVDRKRLNLDNTEAENLARFLEHLRWKDWRRDDARLDEARAGEMFRSLMNAFEGRTADSLNAFAPALTPDAAGHIPAGEAVAAAIHLDFAGRLAKAAKEKGVASVLGLLSESGTRPYFDAAGFANLAKDIRAGVFKPGKKRAGWMLWLLPMLMIGLIAAFLSLRACETDPPAKAAQLDGIAQPEGAGSAPPPAKVEAPPVTDLAPAIEPPAPPPAPEKVKRKALDELKWRESARFSGKDSSGLQADFAAYVLTGADTWTFASPADIDSGGQRSPVGKAFSAAPFADGFCDLAGVIAVGAASHEGTPELNQGLSDQRAASLNAAINTSAPVCTEAPPERLRLLLGPNLRTVACDGGAAICPDKTAFQRPIALVIIEADDPSTDLVEAFKDGLGAYTNAGGEIFPGVKASDYSDFQILP